MNGTSLAIFVSVAMVCRADTIPLVRGSVESDRPLVGNSLTVELDTRDHSSPKLQSQVGGDGSFAFRDVAPGWYVLRVTTMMGATVYDQSVNVSTNGDLAVRLPKSISTNTGSGSVISAQRLREPVPKKAYRAFIDAQRASEDRKRERAIEKLEEAIRIFPQYSEARCNLGVHYIRMGRLADAEREFDRAIADGPDTQMVYSNLAYVLMSTGRLAEAEQTARRAIAVDSSAAPAHYMLGSILTVNRNFDEAVKHLRFAAREIPKAHLTIAKIEQHAGHGSEAAEELRLYLKSGNPADRPDVERWLSALRSK